jgi:ATP-dependent exoDNAse (exonuclease V) beta subunit
MVSATALSAAAFEARADGKASPFPAAAAPFPATAVDGLDLPEKDFGTICHAFIEDLVNGREASLESLSSGPEASLVAGLGETEKRLVADEALRLARGFVDSEFGREVLGFPRVETEKPFYLGLGDKTVAGRFDLFAESETEIRILDFKSNRGRARLEYEGQLALYRLAAAGLEAGKQVRSWLFWLRAGEAEEVSGGPGEEELAGLAAALAARTGSEGSASPVEEDTVF